MSDASFWVVVPASGVGSRMNSNCPKQYLPLLNKTVIEITLDRLLSFEAIQGAVVVIGAEDTYWQGLNYSHTKPVLLAEGGAERFESVYSGLKKIKSLEESDSIWVMIHDAVRPCITHEDLLQIVSASSDSPEGLFLAHPVADTLKQANQSLECMATIDRSNLWRAFTPQVFPLPLIMHALQHVLDKKVAVTDDVSAVESLGLHPKIILGRSDNIKITYPQDLAIAEVLIKMQRP